MRNLLIVWFTTGLWHGASWNFVLWGMFHALFLLLEKNIYGKALEKLPSFIRHFYAVVIVVFGFGIFAITDFGQMFDYFRSLFGLNHNLWIDSRFVYYLTNFKLILPAAFILAFPVYPYLRDRLYKVKNKALRLGIQLGSAVVFMLCFAVSVSSLVADSYNPFLYFRF